MTTRLVSLQSRPGFVLWINPANVTAIADAVGGGCDIAFVGGEKFRVMTDAKETAYRIMDKPID